MPPYCGVPSLSHQLPEALVDVLVGLVVTAVADVVTAPVDVVAGLEVVVVEIVVEVAVPQEARSIATTRAMLRVNHKIFLFKLSSI